MANELRARFYVYMKLIESLDHSNSGVVIVSYCVGRFRDSMVGAGLIDNTMLGMAMPFHIGGIHICMDSDQREAMVVKAAIVVCSTTMKAKVKLHTGSHQECQYLLSTFGIPLAALPISFLSNDAIFERQLSWYHECLRSEQEPKGIRDAASNENDVLYLGRTVNNAGNERLRTLVARHAETYNSGSSKDKRNAVDLIIDSIRQNSGRFLKPSEGGKDWREVPVSEVRSKISQMFRNQKRARSSVRDPTNHREGPIIDTVFEDDVLFGRIYDHIGNKKLRQLVEKMAGEYNASNRGRKKEIADFLVGTVKRNGCRFLKPTDDGRWIEVSDKVAEAKVSSHFRNFRRKANREEK